MTEQDMVRLSDAEHDKTRSEMAAAQTKDDSKKNASPVKSFSHRNSVLTDLMELNHFQTVYNISVAVCILLLFNAIAYYLTVPVKFWSDLETIKWASGKLYEFSITWILVNVACASVHQMLRLWAYKRHSVPLKMLDYIFLLYFIAVIGLIFAFTPYAVLTYEIPPITAFALLCEQVRMCMKIYSFVRENYPRIIRYNPEKDGKQQLCPTFKHFMYFMFAPVLVYRDVYPRTEKIRWSFVVTNLLKVVACVFITYCMFFRFIVDIFSEVGLKPFRLSHMALIGTGSMVVGSMFMFLIFYAILHSWLNAFAEMLRFGDRLFYKDWWNSTSFLQYYRMWNGVVYDWLYTYIYVDVHKLGVNRHVARLNVFVVSAIVHEYIICLALGYFFPALGIVYCTVGVTVIFVTNRKTSSAWNTFMWVFLFSGWGLLIFMHACEWYARRNCVVSQSDSSSYEPRFLQCLRIENS